MKYRRLVFVLAIVVFNAILANATTVRRLTFDDLVSKASTIVQGHVINTNTAWTDDHKLILTTYTLAVDERLKGATGQQTVTVTSIGGQVGNKILHVSGMPAFAQGESAVVFLEQSGKYSTVVGLSQGKFSVRDGQVANSTAGLDFSGGASATAIKMPIDEFKRQIRLRLGK